jgi:hypothetical protein
MGVEGWRLYEGERGREWRKKQPGGGERRKEREGSIQWRMQSEWMEGEGVMRRYEI